MVIKHLQSRFDDLVWNNDLSQLPLWKIRGIKLLRLAYRVIKDLADGQLTLRAMSLVYTTLLSLVPLLAVSFSVLKAFGVHNQIEPMLLNFLAPMGEKGVEISATVIGFVENMKAGVLGSVGLAFLFYTVIALLQKVERAFNYTWRIKHTRPLAQRFSQYLSVLMVGPVLIFTAMGIMVSVASASIMQDIAATQAVGTALKTIGRLAPYILVIAAFTFVYVLVPNTKVHLRSALVGAVASGFLWETSGWAFATFLANSVNYTAIYSAFASLVLFMIWLYLSWLILLLGTSIAFYHQHPEHLCRREQELDLSNRFQEKLAIQILVLIGNSYYHNHPPWTLPALIQHLMLPGDVVGKVILRLEKNQLIACTNNGNATYLPAQPLEELPLGRVLSLMRSTGDDTLLTTHGTQLDTSVETVFTELEQCIETTLQGKTIKDLTSAYIPQQESAENMSVDLQKPGSQKKAEVIKS